jgi:hypothetical protein
LQIAMHGHEVNFFRRERINDIEQRKEKYFIDCSLIRIFRKIALESRKALFGFR